MRLITQAARQIRNWLQIYGTLTEARPLESFLGEVTLGWGLWLVLPMDSFGAAPAFVSLAHFLPEWAWGIMAMISGALMLVGILRGFKRPVRWGFIAASGLWLTVVVGLLLSTWWTTGTIIYGLIAYRVFRQGARL